MTQSASEAASGLEAPGAEAGWLSGATIVFDLDGTLVDSAPDLVRALNETLDLEGLPHLALGKARGMIGGGARALIERSVAQAGVAFSSERLDQLMEAFLGFYQADIARETRPFDGVGDALAQLSAAGAKLAVCTNKRTDLSLQLLEALGLLDRFACVIGSDAVAHRKPHPEHYRAAVERAGGVVERSLMVGDTEADVGAAREAGAPAAVVTFGYGAYESLGADALIRSYDELEGVCRRLLAPA